MIIDLLIILCIVKKAFEFFFFFWGVGGGGGGWGSLTLWPLNKMVGFWGYKSNIKIKIVMM